MYVILVYDVGQKRVHKMMKTCWSYLHHVQRSVFEGNITEGKLNQLKKELIGLIDVRADAVSIYKVGSMRYSSRESIGATTKIETIQ